jgi:hypothetical protein
VGARSRCSTVGATSFEIASTERFSDAATLRCESLGSFAISPDGGYLLMARDGAALLYPLSPARLVERFWQATRYCLPVDERIRRFGEAEAEAKADYAAAEQRQAQVGQDIEPD